VILHLTWHCLDTVVLCSQFPLTSLSLIYSNSCTPAECEFNLTEINIEQLQSHALWDTLVVGVECRKNKDNGRHNTPLKFR
jgi:hypothetical protein